jgi:hypothetical protein
MPRGPATIADRVDQILGSLDDPHPVPAPAVAYAMAMLDFAAHDLRVAEQAQSNQQPITAIKAAGRGRKRVERATTMLNQALVGPADRAPTPPAALFGDALEALAEAAQDIDDAVGHFDHAMIEAGREGQLQNDPAFSDLLGALVVAKVRLDERRQDLDRRYRTIPPSAQHLPRAPRN